MDNLGALIFDSFIKGIGNSVRLLWQGLWANPWLAVCLIVLICMSVLATRYRRRH